MQEASLVAEGRAPAGHSSSVRCSNGVGGLAAVADQSGRTVGATPATAGALSRLGNLPAVAAHERVVSR